MSNKKSDENIPEKLDVPEFVQKKTYQQVKFRSGPLPAPEELQRYEFIHPGAADRIITMAESQGKHRRELEERVIKADIWDGHMALIFAFILALVCLVGGIYLLENDHYIAGTIFAGVGVTAIIRAFLGHKDLRTK
jgi:uncharacterized membrane protein